jgi:hypothetical protein
MTHARRFTVEEAQRAGEQVGIDCRFRAAPMCRLGDGSAATTAVSWSSVITGVAPELAEVRRAPLDCMFGGSQPAARRPGLRREASSTLAASSSGPEPCRVGRGVAWLHASHQEHPDLDGE